VFKKIANVDVEDVFRSVTGIHVFQEKMNLADSGSVQKLALQLNSEGQGQGAKGNVAMSYRASKVKDLDKLASLVGEEVGQAEDLGSDISSKKKDATISKLFGSSKPKSKKLEATSVSGPATASASASASASGKLVVKKKSVLEPVSLEATPSSASASTSTSASASTASIIGKSKAGTKASLSKLGKLKLGSSSKDEE
jgi:hypothetical protein